MLYKALILIAILFIIYIIFFKKPNIKRDANKKSISKGNTMLECKECGTFVSEDETVIKDAQFYCSKNCAGVKL